MKKSFKKIASLVMAMVLTLSMALNVSAADITDETPEKSTVKFTDIQEGNHLCHRQLQTVQTASVEVDEKTDFDDPYKGQYDRRDRADYEVVK